MSPGYDRPAHLDFRRVIDDGCMSCHNGYPRDPVQDDGTGPKFPPRCPKASIASAVTGPGRRISMRWPPATWTGGRRAIVNPGTLDRERQLEVCLQCHLEPTSSPLPFQLRRVGRPPHVLCPGNAARRHVPLLRPRADARPRTTALADKFEIAGVRLPAGEVGVLPGQPDDLPDLPRPARRARAATRPCSTTPRPARAATRRCTPPARLGWPAPDHARPASTATCRGAGPRTPSTW